MLLGSLPVLSSPKKVKWSNRLKIENISSVEDCVYMN